MDKIEIKKAKEIIIKKCKSGQLRTSVFQKIRFLFTNKISIGIATYENVEFVVIGEEE